MSARKKQSGEIIEPSNYGLIKQIVRMVKDHGDGERTTELISDLITGSGYVLIEKQKEHDKT